MTLTFTVCKNRYSQDIKNYHIKNIFALLFPNIDIFGYQMSSNYDFLEIIFIEKKQVDKLNLLAIVNFYEQFS